MSRLELERRSPAPGPTATGRASGGRKTGRTPASSAPCAGVGQRRACGGKWRSDGALRSPLSALGQRREKGAASVVVLAGVAVLRCRVVEVVPLVAGPEVNDDDDQHDDREQPDRYYGGERDGEDGKGGERGVQARSFRPGFTGAGQHQRNTGPAG